MSNSHPGSKKTVFFPESYRIQVRSDQFLHRDLGPPQFEANAPFLFGSPSSQNSKGAGGAYRAPPQNETKSREKLEAWQPGVTRDAEEEEEEEATQRSDTLSNNQCKGKRVCGGRVSAYSPTLVSDPVNFRDQKNLFHAHTFYKGYTRAPK